MNTIRNNNKENFRRGDFVIVFGISVSGQQRAEPVSRIVAEVCEAGQFDLFLKCTKSGSLFRHSKKSCELIGAPPNALHRVVSPQIGDLVLSFVGGRYSAKEEKLVGILMELIDKPPFALSASILVADKTHIVSYDSLIVLEKR